MYFFIPHLINFLLYVFYPNFVNTKQKPMARDKIHDVVRIALENDGWTVTKDPLVLRPFEKRIEIDIAAERVIIAEKARKRLLWRSKVLQPLRLCILFIKQLGSILTT